MDSMIDLGFIELPQTLVAFCNSLTTDEVVCIMTLTSPEDWDGDDMTIISKLKGILYCEMQCNQMDDNYDKHCDGCYRNPRQ